MKGLIIAGTNNLFTVECDDEKTRFCTIKGKVLKSEKECAILIICDISMEK